MQKILNEQGKLSRPALASPSSFLGLDGASYLYSAAEGPMSVLGQGARM